MESKTHEEFNKEINKRIDNARNGKVSQVIVKDEGHGHITVRIVPPSLDNELEKETILKRIIKYLVG